MSEEKKTELPGINRIKISAGGRFKVGDHYVCEQRGTWGMNICDAETGQGLFFCKGVEIITTAEGAIVKLIVHEDSIDLDLHIKE